MDPERNIDGFADTEISGQSTGQSVGQPGGQTRGPTTGSTTGAANTLPAPGAGDAADPPFPDSDPERYQVLAEHARGGLGRIIKARDQRLGRIVAIKELHQSTSLAESLFVREALVTARLQHPGIVPVHEAGRWPSGAPFYVMKLVSGKSLQDLIRERGALADRLALLPNAMAVVETIAYAHSQGVIHRDIKPANVMVGKFGETVVVDWGLARSGPEGAVSGKVMGTPAYMAPEQARGQAVDERADVYALGALLYELLTGAPPYADADTGSVLEQVLAGPPRPLSGYRAPMPPDLVTIADKAMARDPADRYPTAKELADELHRFQTGQLVSAHRYSTWTLIRRWLWRHRSPVLVALAGLITLAVIAVLSVSRIMEESERAEAERAQARVAQRAAETGRNELLILQAESALEHDPTATLAWLKEAPLDGARFPFARNLYDEAVVRGVARHVLRHDDQAYGLCFIAGGAHLLTAGKDGTVRRLDVATGNHRVIARSDEGLSAVTVSPDGAWLVAGTDAGALQVWPMNGSPDDPPAQRMPGHASTVYGLRFTDDDTLVSFANDMSLRVWRWRPSGVTPMRSFASAATFSVRGDRMAMGHPSGEVIVQDRTTGAEVWRTVQAKPPRALSLSPDGTRLAVKSRSGDLRLIDLDTGAVTQMGEARNPYMRPLLAFSPRGRWLVTGGPSWSIHLWDLSSGERRLLRGHEDGIYGVSFSGDETRMASASDDGTARLWDLSTGDVQVLRGHTDDVIRALFSPRGDAVATASLDGSVRLWPVHSAAGQHLGMQPGWMSKLRFSDAETLVALGLGGEIRTWHVPAAGSEHVARTPSGGAQAPGEYSPDNRFLAVADRDAGGKGRIEIWDLAGDTRRTLQTGGISVASLALAPGGRELVTADQGGTVRLWKPGQPGEVDGPVELRRGGTVCAMQWSPDGSMLAIMTPHMVEVWDMARRAGKDAFLLPGGGTCMALPWSLVMFSPDSTLLAVPAGLHGLMLWSLHPRSVQHIDTHRHRLTSIDFSPDGTLLAGAPGDRSVWLWHLGSGRDDIQAQRLGHHDDLIMQVAFSPDGRMLASASYDSDLRLWDLATGSFRALHGHDSSVDTLAFSPHGRWLASGSRDLDIRLWEARKNPVPDAATLRARLDITTTAVIAPDRHHVHTP